MKASKETLFVGANVKFENKDYIVVKINQKTAYITQDKELLKRIRLKLTGVKALDMIKQASLMIDIALMEISDEELKKKDVAEKVAELKKKNKKVLSSVAQKMLDTKIAKAINPKDKTMSWKNMFDCGQGNFCTILLVNKEKKIALISVEGDKYFYDFGEDVYIKYNPTKHKDGYGDKNILWDKVKE